MCSPGHRGRRWKSASENDEPIWYGQIETYPGSGYVVSAVLCRRQLHGITIEFILQVELPLDATLAKDLLTKMKNNSFLDASTAVLFIDFQVGLAVAALVAVT